MAEQHRSLLNSKAGNLLSLVPAALLLSEFTLPAVPNTVDSLKAAPMLLESLDGRRDFLSTTNSPARKAENFSHQVSYAITNKFADRFLVAQGIAQNRAKVEALKERTGISYVVTAQANPLSAAAIDRLQFIFRFDPPAVDLLTLEGRPRERALTSDLICDTGKDGNHRFFVITIPANLSRAQGEFTAHIGKQMLTALAWDRFLESKKDEPGKGLVGQKPPDHIQREADFEVTAELESMAKGFLKTARHLSKQEVKPGSIDEAGNEFFSTFAATFSASVDEMRRALTNSTR